MEPGPTRRDLLTSLGGLAAAGVAAGTGTASPKVSSQETTDEWPMFGHDAANTSYNPAAEGLRSDVGPAWTFETGGQITTSAAVVDGTAFIASREDQTLYALSSDTGDKEWEFSTDSDIRSSPAVATIDGTQSEATANGKTVYLGTEAGTIYAIDADSGTLNWRFGTEDTVRSSPAVVDGTVYVGSRDKTVYAIDAVEGTEEWTFETGWFVDSSPAVVDGTVYVGSDDGNVYALDANDGTKHWEFPTGDRVPAAPAVQGGTVYVGSLDQTVYAIDAETGDKQWTFDAGGAVVASPAVVPESDGTSGSVYIGTRGQKLFALDPTSGTKRWEFEIEREIRGSPTVADGVVYVGSTSSRVFGVGAETGDKLWQFDAGLAVTAAPTIVGETVYIGSDNQNFYALEEGATGSSSTATPAPAAGDDGNDLRFVLFPFALLSLVATVFGTLYVAYRAGLLEVPPPPDIDSSDGETQTGTDDTAATADDTTDFWELMIDDVIARADESEKAATQNVVVTKYVDEDTLTSPVVAYEIESVRDDLARVSLTEPLLDGSEKDTQPMGNGWTVAGDDVVFEALVEPGETVTTLVGRPDCPSDATRRLHDQPSVTVDGDADEPSDSETDDTGTS